MTIKTTWGRGCCVCHRDIDVHQPHQAFLLNPPEQRREDGRDYYFAHSGCTPLTHYGQVDVAAISVEQFP